LVKLQNHSDAAKGVIDKCMHMHQGPYSVNKTLPHSNYDTADGDGKVSGECNKRQMKACRTESDTQNPLSF